MEYRIVFEILPIWKNNYHIPSLDIELLNKKGLQIFIETMAPCSDESLNEAIECAHADFDSVLREKIDVEDLMNLIDIHLTRVQYHRDALNGKGALVLKLMLASYYGTMNMVNSVNKQITKLSRKIGRKPGPAFLPYVYR